ncbi:MAG: tetratricopeptide repeat protein [Terriglobia bacterium]
MCGRGQQTFVVIVVAILAISLRAQSLLKAKTATSEIPQQASSNQRNVRAQELFNQAATLIKENHYSEAASLLRTAVKLAPDQASIHHYLGYALWKLDQWNNAEAEFEKAHHLDPRNPYTCYFLARIAGSLNHPDQSIEYYQAVLRLGPAIYDTNQRLGQAYLDRGELAKARVRIEAALKQTPWNGSLYYQLGRIDQSEHHLAQAQQEFAAANRLQHVNQAEIQRLLELYVAVQKRQTPQIQALLGTFLNETAADPEILNSVGVSLGRGGLYSAAVEPLERAVALAPDSFESNYNLGLTLFKLGRTQDAESSLKKALALQPQSPEANRLLAVLDVEENRNTEAISRLQVANQASPGDERVLALLGEQYLAGHYVNDAIPCFTQAIKLQPEDPALRYLLIEAYQEKDDFQDALTAAHDAIQQFPNAPRAVYEVGHQLANLGHYHQARLYAEKAIQMDSTMVDAYNLLGDIESRSGQYEAAIKTFTRARALNPKDRMALSGIGENLIRLGRLNDAVSELNQAIAAEPEDSDLYFNLIQAYMRLGQRQKATQAEAAFQKFHALEVAQRNARAPRSFSPSTTASELR